MQLRNTDPIAFLQVCNTRAERDTDIRQNPSMLELIQVHVDCGADHLSGPSVPLPNSTSRGATRANNKSGTYSVNLRRIRPGSRNRTGTRR